MEYAIPVWTAERLAMLDAELPFSSDDEALLARLNALPGHPISSVKAVRQKAFNRGIKRDPAAVARMRSEGGSRGNALRKTIPTVTRPVATWLPERIEMMRTEWPTCTDRVALWRRLGELPGEPIASVLAVRRQARKMGLCTTEETRHAAMRRGRRHVAKKAPVQVKQEFRPASVAPAEMPRGPTLLPVQEREPAPVVERRPELADAAAEARYQRQLDAVRRAMERHRGDIPWEATVGLANGLSIPPARVRMLVGQVRQETRVRPQEGVRL